MKRLVIVLLCGAFVLLGASRSAEAAGGDVQPADTEAAASKEEDEGECDPSRSRQINERAHPNGTPTGPIELTVHATDPVLNFGSGRGIQSDYIVLKASEPIPEHIYSTSFEIDSLEPLRRIGSESLESVRMVSPTYTRPHFFNHRKEIGFSLCVSASHAEPGTYTGQFLFVGPGDMSSAIITQTAQMKAEKWDFYLWLFVVLALTFVFLMVKAYAELEPGTKPKELLIKLFLLLVSVAAAGLAMLLVYAESPTWGENQTVSIAALIATAFTAVGLGNTLSGGSEKVAKTLDKAREGRKSLKEAAGD